MLAEFGHVHEERAVGRERVDFLAEELKDAAVEYGVDLIHVIEADGRVAVLGLVERVLEQLERHGVGPDSGRVLQRHRLRHVAEHNPETIRYMNVNKSFQAETRNFL